MWIELIDLLLREITKIREPRKRLIQELKELLNALEECHLSYQKYRYHPGYKIIRTVPFYKSYNYEDVKDTLKEYEKYADAHTKSINNLLNVLWNLRETMSVFAPDVMDHLWNYTRHEIQIRIPETKEQEFKKRFGENRLYEVLHELSMTQAYGISDKIKHNKIDTIRLDSDALEIVQYAQLAAWAWGDTSEGTEYLKTDYETATKKLRKFIKKEFKPDEFF